MPMPRRCCVCGTPVQTDEEVIRIDHVKRGAKTGWKPHKTWGYAHYKCFTTAIDCPSMVMDELRKQSAAVEPDV